MTNPLKSLAAWLLKNELSALKTRLSEASTALDNIANKAVAVEKEAVAEVHTFAQSVLKDVLSSADKVRTKEGPFVNEWTQKLYLDYQGALTKVELVATKAEALVKKTETFIEKL